MLHGHEGANNLARKTTAVDWPAAIHGVLKQFDVRQVAYVPDAGHTRLIQACHADRAMSAIVLTTEEEGIGIATGAWFGGQRSALLMQSSGVGNCMNTLSLATVCNCPLLMLVTMRGDWGEFNPWQIPMGQSTEALLKTCGLIVMRVDDPARVGETVNAAAMLAYNGPNQVAVLLGQRLIGSKSFK